MAATSLYSSEQKDSLDRSASDSEDSSEFAGRDLTKSGPLLPEPNQETARTAPVLNSLDEVKEPANAKGRGLKLILVAVFIAVLVVLWMGVRS